MVGAIVLAATVGVVVHKSDELKKRIDDLEDEAKVCTSPECVQSAAFILDGINSSVDPCDDFFTFACGNWIKNHPIPDDKERYGNFDELAVKVRNQYKELLSATSQDNETEAIKKTKTMYKACLDEEKVWNLTQPMVLDTLNKYGGWPIANPSVNGSDFDWIKVEASFKRDPATPMDYASSIINFYVTFDAKNTDRNIIYIDQPLLGLGQSYLLAPKNYTTQIDAYKALMNGVALYFGMGTVDAQIVTEQVDKMLQLETEIAKISMTPTEKRQKDKIYNNMTIGELQSLTSQNYSEFKWLELAQEVFKGIYDIGDTEPIIVVDKNYIENLGTLLSKTEKRDLANYMLWRYVSPQLRHISKETRELYNVYVKAMTGVDKPPERWVLCANEVDGSLGMALSSMFVAKAFHNSSKLEAEEMIAEIRYSFTSMLDDNDWMDAETKIVAKEKAAKMEVHIGYPDWIVEPAKLNKYYQNTSINEENHALNLKSAAMTESWRSLHSLKDQPVDKTIWFMTPGTVNAYYVPELNSITFPAGILQNPFFQGGRMKALNFGGIGAVIGHEITHGFDDEGRQYDKAGNVVDWWIPADIDSFTKKANCYVEQYGSYCPANLPNSNACVDGTNTLGENIADNGGIKAAYQAYRKWVEKNKEEQRLPGLDKYTPDQLFYISFGQLWCSNIRPEALLNQVLKDPHSPAVYRIIGTVSNSKEFATAYNCDESRKMNRGKDRCELW